MTDRPTLVFYPWVSINATVSTPGIEFRHYVADDNSWSSDIQAIVRAYEDAPGRPVQQATLVAYDGEVGGSLSEDQVDAAFALRDAVSFTALRQRRFFEWSGYCNDHAFTCVAQSYRQGDPGVTVRSRRRDGGGRHSVGCEHRVVRPSHVTVESPIVLDDAVLRAITTASEDDDYEWVRDGIELFNLANTDSPQTRTHTELILTAAAAQRILGVEKKCEAQVIAGRFAELVASVAPPVLKISDSSRPIKGAESLHAAWFFDLYSDRNVVSHGRPGRLGNRLWTREQHLLLASYILPRILLVRLSESGRYALTQDDRDEIGAFEYLLCLDDTFGSATEGVRTGLPARLFPQNAKYAWSEALRMGLYEPRFHRILKELGVQS